MRKETEMWLAPQRPFTWGIFPTFVKRVRESDSEEHMNESQHFARW